MKTLETLLTKVEFIKILGTADVQVSGIIFDSRTAAPNTLFVAVKGYQTDGHAYIDAAIEKGSNVIVCETLPAVVHKNTVFVQVADAALALGLMASNFYDNPSSKLKLIGVTGTNGKTTTVTLLYQLFQKLGYKAGLLSTIRNYIHLQVVEATHTTPDPVQLQQLLAQMADAGCDYVFMEVSSHALHQKRVAGLAFDGAVFTNITQDHLDYHKTFAEYIKAKKIFFDNLDKQAFALINADDKNGKIMVQNTAASLNTYALHSMAKFMGKVLETDVNGMLLTFDNTEVWTRFIGGFNAYNLLSVYAVALLLGQKRNEVIQAISNLEPVDGRFQYLRSKSGKLAIVDYAHTPDALENVLTTINELCQGNCKIITVFGAGGNRDKTKRPLMGAVAAKMSHQVIITSDNPRNENPETIIEEIRAGVKPPFNNKLLAITNRAEAIKTACMLAQPGDMVLVAGKGHETYQEIQGVKHHFDDREIISQIFETE